MDELTKLIEKNKGLIVVCIAALMLLFFACCSAVDIYGKAQASGFRILFKGNDLGFARFLTALMIIVPILVIVGNYVDLKLTGKLKELFNTVCFGAAFVLCLLLCAVLPEGLSLAWGGWLYLVLAVAGAAVGCLDMIAKNKILKYNG